MDGPSSLSYLSSPPLLTLPPFSSLSSPSLSLPPPPSPAPLPPPSPLPPPPSKGASWIPADAFDSRISREGLRRLLLSATEAHQNMLRVWGGGNYGSSMFWEL
jgi:hypothetical protein